MAVKYPNSIQRTASGKAGDYPSVLDFGSSDGVHDVSTILNNAVASVDGQGRGYLYIPGGTYVLDGTSPWLFPSTMTGGMTILGDPGKTIIQVKAGSTFSSSHGAIDIKCSGLKFKDIIIDGGVTTPTNMLYSAVASGGGNPNQSALIANSTFWIHPAGGSNYTFDGCTIQHTAGYAIAADATGGECSNLNILNSQFLNNRPFLFGVDGTVWGGAWTGGIILFGDGTANMWHSVLMQGCLFQCNTGNAFWQWAPALSYLHTNISAIGNTFIDNALDGIEMGAVDGGSVANNTFRRIGYVSTSDGAIGNPVWVSNANGCAIDSTGVVINVNVTGNNIISCNGQAINTDGFGSATISGNTVRIPASTDPEYTIDQTASCGPQGYTGQNWMGGVQFSNTSDTEQGDQDVSITGNTFINLGGGAVGLYASRNCIVSGNNIQHPANAQQPPITIGNIGSGTYQRATGNVVTGNVLSWSPGSSASMVFENPNGTAFLSTQFNQVYNNICTPGMVEFESDSNSGSAVGGSPSGTAHLFSTNYPGSTTASSHSVQREGRNSDQSAVLRWYGTENTTSTLQMNLQSYCVGGSHAVYAPLLNISKAGTSGTGTIMTGNRTSVAQDSTGTYTLQDTVGTGNLYADCQLILTNTTYSDNQANILNEVQGGGSTGTAVYAAFRYKPSVGYVEESISISSGSRVWQALGAAAIGGSDKDVQYNKSGGFGGDANFQWDYTNQVLTVTGKTGTAGIAAASSYVQADQGFYTTSTSFQAIQAPSGGLFGKSVSLKDYVGIAPVAIGSLAPTTGDNWDSGSNPTGVFSFDLLSGTPFFYLSYGTGTSTLADANAHANGYYATSSSYQAFQALSGGVNTNSASLAGYLGIASNGSITQSSGDNWSSAPGVLYFDSANWYFKVGNGTSTLGDTAILNANGVNVSGTLINSLQCASGGVTAQWLVATDSVFWTAESAPAVSGSGQARLYLDSSSNELKVSINGGSYTPLSTGSATTPGGSNTNVQFNSSGSFGGSGNFTWNNSTQLLTVTAASSTDAGIACGTGFMQADTGFYATSGLATSYQSINTPTGGVYGNSLRAVVYTQIGQNSGAPTMTTGDSLQAGCLYWDTGSTAAKIYNGTSWATLSTGGSTPPGGSNTEVQYNSSGSFAGSSNFTWNNSSQLLTITASSSSAAGLAVGTGYVQADAGFLATSGTATSYQAIQAPGGGVYGKSLRAIAYTQIGTNSGAPTMTTGDSLQDGCLYWDTGSSYAKIYNGSSWLPLNLTAGTGLSISGNTISCTITGAPGGSNTQVQYNSSGSFAGSSNFTWNNSSQLLAVTGTSTSSAAVSVASGYVQSAGGFLTSDTAYNSIQTSGGVYGELGMTSDEAYYVKALSSAPNSPASGYGGIGYKGGTSGLVHWVWNGSSFTQIDFGSIGGSTPPGGSNTDVQFNNSGSFGGSSNFTWNNSSQLLTITATSSSAAGLVVGTGYIQSDAGFYATSGTATSYQAIQAPGGGLYGKSLRAIYYTQLGSSSGAPTPTSGDTLVSGATYWDTGSSYAKIYNGSSWLPLNLTSGTGISISGNTVSTSLTAGTGISISGATISTNLSAGTGISISGSTITCTVSGAAPGGSSTNVQYNSSGTFAGSGNFIWNNSSQQLTIYGSSSGVAALAVGTGYIQADAGFLATSGTANSYQSINAPTGGLYGRSHRSIVYSQIGNNAGAPTMTSGDSVQAGCVYWDTTSGYAKISNGSGYLPLNLTASTGISISGNSISTNLSSGTGISVSGATISVSLSAGTGISISGATITNTGITSLTAGTGVSVSGSTISIGQNVSTSSSVTFNALAISSSASNSINTSGGIDCAAVYCSTYAYNSLEVAGGIEVGLSGTAYNMFTSSYYGAIINNTGAFVGTGVSCPNYGIGGAGHNYWNGSSWDYGTSVTLSSISSLSFGGGILYNYSGSSDARLKTVLEDKVEGLAVIRGLEPVVYHWNETASKTFGSAMNKKQWGLIAQNVQKYVPDAVFEDRGYLGYEKDAIIANLIAAVKQLDAELTILKEKAA